MSEILKLQLTRSALERLIGEDVEMEISLQKNVCKEIIKKHFRQLANDELWRLSHGMTESIAEEVEKIVQDFAKGEKQPTGKYKWFLTQPTTDTVQRMIIAATKNYLKDEIENGVQKAVKELTIGNEDLQQMITRIAKNAVRDQIRQEASQAITQQVKEEIQLAVKQQLENIVIKVV